MYNMNISTIFSIIEDKKSNKLIEICNLNKDYGLIISYFDDTKGNIVSSLYGVFRKVHL